ncbi:substrate-binding domain-containing protein [Paenibacillus sp. CC-CFT747]|nr:substrate-binding domain-containing protein [Paenibacillus sp. CC-CFT747]
MTDGDPAKEKKHLDTLLQRNAEGVLMVPSAGFTFQDLNPLQQEGIPYLLVGQGEDNETATRILLDHRQAAYLATECLLRMKHEKIGYIGGPLTRQDEAGRIEGYKKALYDHGIAFNRIFVYEAVEQEGKQAGYEGVVSFCLKG